VSRGIEAPPKAFLSQLAPAARRLTSHVRLRLGVGAGVVALLAAITIAVVMTMARGAGTTSVIQPVDGSSAPGRSSAPANVSSSTIFVHVLGAVRNPGLFELAHEARAVDAIGAAGGFTETADTASINLARFVSDGEQLHVPQRGEVPASPNLSVPGAASQNAKVNINSASSAELEELPRIGPAMAKRIIDWREQNGRFTSIEDLMNVTGIGDKTFEALKDLVTV
jgi:competence protein ComEA